MKYLTSQIAAFMDNRAGRRNIRMLVRILAVIVMMIVVYSITFHYMMEREGKEHSWLTGFYWTLTVMSTLGFGDITFHSDGGRLFSMLVLISGMVFFLVLLPFTLIEFFYAPWMEAQSRARAPRELAEETQGHVIVTHQDAVTAALIRKLKQYGYPYALLVKDVELALRLHDEEFRVVVGDPDLPETYERLRLAQAALVAATGKDVENTNIAFTVRELSQAVPVITTASGEAAAEILKLAGASRVFCLGELMGQSLARRTTAGDAVTHVIGRFDKLLIAEATVAGTPLVGKTLAEAKLRELAGVTVVGVWERGEFEIAGPETQMTQKTVLVMAGTGEQLRQYDALFCIYHVTSAPVVIIGGGRVGRSTAQALAQREVDFRVVELLAQRVAYLGTRAVIGNASELEVLEKAGLTEAPAVIITTRDDDTNIYLTILCRKLRPDIQIISRATQDRNVSTLHRAGADFVMSYASMGASIIFNYLKRSDLLLVAEGLNIFRVRVPGSMVGHSLAELGLRQRTGCHVMAVGREGEMEINPDPRRPFEGGEEIMLISSTEAEGQFFELFGDQNRE